MPVVRWRSRTRPARLAVVGLLGAILVGSLPAAAAAAGPARPDRLPAAAVDPGGATTVIVRYREGTSSARRTAARERAQATRERSRPDKGREVVRPAHGRSVAETVQALLADPAVAYAEPNYPVQLAANPMTEPLRAPYQWGLENGGGECVDELRARLRQRRRHRRRGGLAGLRRARAWSSRSSMTASTSRTPTWTPRRGRTRTTRRSTAGRRRERLRRRRPRGQPVRAPPARRPSCTARARTFTAPPSRASSRPPRTAPGWQASRPMPS